MSVIEIKDLTFAYRKNEYVIKGINLTINRGEYICILGHNGSGKSTLAKLIVGLLFPSSGEIYIDGELFN
ncbi:MAG TPA: ATP-binding cassette domain-containing protein, partial [Bacilli bacterium]|nr:ATP-binding cassette domain-containing protein [Bacilli bacterium]